ncbi:hypothetical protein [uncultured Propionibacterium sp.]|uniref:hypothetical protein n=1 Tax=uncultured Propionibacterium sp. TaxID=218066 RepID=UPI0029316941|nr:hypothetical protein [uncultured Propionibacterium sp.]
MTERPEFVDPIPAEESAFSPGRQDASPQETRPVAGGDGAPGAAAAPSQNPAGADPHAAPAGRPRTAQPFPHAGNYRDPAAPVRSGVPSAPQDNYWQPRQASSDEFQAFQGYGARAFGYDQGLPAVPAPAAPGPYYDLGPIRIRGNTVITPNGTIPLSRAQFFFQDMSRTTKSTPTWAIVLAIVLAWFFLLSLLLLIIQEENTTGQITVVVTGGEGAYCLVVPVTSQAQVHIWAQQVQQAQMIAAQSRM